jgi:hypothetical protein
MMQCGVSNCCRGGAVEARHRGVVGLYEGPSRWPVVALKTMTRWLM